MQNNNNEMNESIQNIPKKSIPFSFGSISNLEHEYNRKDERIETSVLLMLEQNEKIKNNLDKYTFAYEKLKRENEELRTKCNLLEDKLREQQTIIDNYHTKEWTYKMRIEELENHIKSIHIENKKRATNSLNYKSPIIWDNSNNSSLNKTNHFFLDDDDEYNDINEDPQVNKRQPQPTFMNVLGVKDKDNNDKIHDHSMIDNNGSGTKPTMNSNIIANEHEHTNQYEYTATKEISPIKKSKNPSSYNDEEIQKSINEKIENIKKINSPIMVAHIEDKYPSQNVVNKIDTPLFNEKIKPFNPKRLTLPGEGIKLRISKNELNEIKDSNGKIISSKKTQIIFNRMATLSNNNTGANIVSHNNNITPSQNTDSLPKNKSIISQNKTVSKMPSKKLFEEFFIMGIKKDDIMEFNKNPDFKKKKLPPRVLYNYPSDEAKMDQPPRNSVKEHIFPFGIKVKKIRTSSFSCAEEIMFNMKYAEINRNCFIFPLLSDETHDQTKKLDDIIEITNPNKLLYFICIKTDDFLKTNEDETEIKRKAKDVYIVQKAYCIMTYYPFIPFFFDLLIEILKSIKITRMEYISTEQIRENMSYEKVDSQFCLSISKVIEDNLKNILQSTIPRFGKSITFDFNLQVNGLKESIKLQLEEKKRAYLIDSVWASPFVFNFFSLKDIIFLFTAVMLEKKIILMSKELCLMTGALSVLCSLIKPFKYPFPLIFNLPETLIPILDAPGGFLVGIQKGEKFLLNANLHNHYSCIFVCLDEQKVYAEHSIIKEISIPTFDGFEKKIQIYYENLNPDVEYQVLKFGSNQIQSPSKIKKIRYQSHPDEKQIALKILELFKETILDRIIKHIPQQPTYVSNKILNYSKVHECIMKNNSVADHYFFNQFIQTQTFTHYIEQFYEIKTRNL